MFKRNLCYLKEKSTLSFSWLIKSLFLLLMFNSANALEWKGYLTEGSVGLPYLKVVDAGTKYLHLTSECTQDGFIAEIEVGIFNIGASLDLTEGAALPPSPLAFHIQPDITFVTPGSSWNPAQFTGFVRGFDIKAVVDVIPGIPVGAGLSNGILRINQAVDSTWIWNGDYDALIGTTELSVGVEFGTSEAHLLSLRRCDVDPVMQFNSFSWSAATEEFGEITFDVPGTAMEMGHCDRYGIGDNNISSDIGFLGLIEVPQLNAVIPISACVYNDHVIYSYSSKEVEMNGISHKLYLDMVGDVHYQRKVDEALNETSEAINYTEAGSFVVKDDFTAEFTLNLKSSEDELGCQLKSQRIGINVNQFRQVTITGNPAVPTTLLPPIFHDLGTSDNRIHAFSPYPDSTIKVVECTEEEEQPEEETNTPTPIGGNGGGNPGSRPTPPSNETYCKHNYSDNELAAYWHLYNGHYRGIPKVSSSDYDRCFHLSIELSDYLYTFDFLPEKPKQEYEICLYNTSERYNIHLKESNNNFHQALKYSRSGLKPNLIIFPENAIRPTRLQLGDNFFTNYSGDPILNFVDFYLDLEAEVSAWDKRCIIDNDDLRYKYEHSYGPSSEYMSVFMSVQTNNHFYLRDDYRTLIVDPYAQYSY